MGNQYTDKDEDRPLRAVGLARISTDQENQPYSLRDQRERIRHFVAARGWILVETIEEEMSGAADHRPQLEHALELARSGAVDVLIVTKVDRLARTIASTHSIVQELKRNNVQLVSVTEPIDTTSSLGKLFLHLLAIFAEFERDTFIERIRAGIQTKASLGLWVGGRPPFGYRLEAKRLVINPDEAAVVQRIFSRYSAGEGANTIAKNLNRDGIRTSRGNRWSSQGVLQVLRRVTYRGDVRHRKQAIQGVHDPIVDPVTFDAVAARLDAASEAAKRRRSRSNYLLSGTLRCGLCDGAMSGALAGGNGGSYRYYQCASSAKARAKCIGVRVSAEELESEFISRLVEAYRSKGFFESAIRTVEEDLPSAIAKINVEINATQSLIVEDAKALDRYFEAFERGQLSGEDTEKRVRTILGAKTAKEARIVQLENQILALESSIDGQPDLSQAAGVVEKTLRGPVTAEKRLFIEAAVASMSVDDHRRVSLTLRVPSPGTLVSETTTLVELGGIEPPSISP